jgi:hypothetical protein
VIVRRYIDPKHSSKKLVRLMKHLRTQKKEKCMTSMERMDLKWVEEMTYSICFLEEEEEEDQVLSRFKKYKLPKKDLK